MLSILAVAVLTSLVTVLALAFTVQPRLEARNRRIQEAHKERDAFGGAVLGILVKCSRVAALDQMPDIPEPVASRLAADRDRWIGGLEGHTQHLVDSIAPISYMPPFGDLLAAYGAHARAVWISERSEDRKLAVLRDLSAEVQSLVFAAWWRRPGRRRAEGRLRALLEKLESGSL